MKHKTEIFKFLLTAHVIGALLFMTGCRDKTDIPVLSTTAVSEITVNSALSGGNITSDGGADISERGICWGTSKNTTISGSHTKDGIGSGHYTSNLNDLNSNTTYYVRAYATNSAGTAYGNEVSFKTDQIVVPVLTTAAITSVESTSAVSGGAVSSDGGSAVTARGVCWNTSTGPTTGNSKTSDGSGTGSFTSNLAGLQPGTVYYVRAYAVNTAGTGYGNELTFTASATTATVTTSEVTGITVNTAVSGGSVTSDGGSSVSAKGVCWSTSADPSVDGSHTSDGTGSAAFTSSISGLSPNTLYYVRAYAANNAGTSYGNVVSFTTSALTVPAIVTSEVTSVSQTSAVSGGNITYDGGSSVTGRGVCWATTANPTISNSKTTNGSGPGEFTSSLGGLQAGTTYHVRAYAVNTTGTGYGDDVTFTTNSSSPAVSTTGITSVTQSTATVGGNVTSSGGETVTARGFCYSTSENPTTSDSYTTNGSGTGSFSGTLSGLNAATVYYVRAYATNNIGTAYGSQVRLVTSMVDIEGNVYKVVQIGSQMWMAENLRTTTYNDNSAIPEITGETEWMNNRGPAYCWLSNNISYRPTFGALYTWYTVNTGKLCPAGWHAPSDDEFMTLEQYLGMDASELNTWGWRGTDQGSQIKSTSGWDNNGNGTNSSGFNALSGGFRMAVDGKFYSLGTGTYWWSSTISGSDPTQGWHRYIDSGYTGIQRQTVYIWGGKYVRCVKN